MLANLAFYPGRFACGVDIVGPSNLETLLKTIPPYWVPIVRQFHDRMGNPNTPEGLALLSEMSALGRRPATRVAPVMFAVQVVVPVILAPLIFEESWSDTPGGGAGLVVAILLILAGVVALAGSKAVGAVIDSAHTEDSSDSHPHG